MRRRLTCRALVEDVAGGEEVVITRRGEEVAKLVPVRRSAARQFGTDRGRFVVPEDFDAPPLPDDLIDAFER
jgi:antitoxin (DNA-binding transcriptional repressor) of toxin-antitoxin stability system